MFSIFFSLLFMTREMEMLIRFRYLHDLCYGVSLIEVASFVCVCITHTASDWSKSKIRFEIACWSNFIEILWRQLLCKIHFWRKTINCDESMVQNEMNRIYSNFKSIIRNRHAPIQYTLSHPKGCNSKCT